MLGGSVLVDTMVILEAHRTGCLGVLTARYRVETVAKCLEEAQTGNHRRSRDSRIAEADLLRGLAAVHPVKKHDRAAILTCDPMASNLDDGERELWAHARQREDAWLLCGPDMASLRLGVRLGYRDRLVSLEHLVTLTGHRPSPGFRRNYTKAWHSEALAKLFRSEGR